MRRNLIFAFFLISSLSLVAGINEDSTRLSKKVSWRYRVDSIADLYGKTLTSLAIQSRAEIAHPSSEKKVDAYSLRMVLPPTFYSSSVLQQFSVNENDIYADPNLLRMYMVNDAFANMYVNNPSIVVQTDDQVEEAGTLRDDVHGSLTTETKLTDKVVNVDLGADMNEGVELVTRKPNFWKLSGSGSLLAQEQYSFCPD